MRQQTPHSDCLICSTYFASCALRSSGAPAIPFCAIIIKGVPSTLKLVASARVAAGFAPGDHGSTFGGNPVACAAGLATLEILLGENMASRCARLGERLAAGLSETGVTVTGEGLIRAAHLEIPAGPVVDRMRERGALVCGAGDKAVRFLPPFITSEAEVDELVEAFAGAL